MIVGISECKQFNRRFRMMFGVVVREVSAKTVAGVEGRMRQASSEAESFFGTLVEVDAAVCDAFVEGDEYFKKVEETLETIEINGFDSVAWLYDGYFRLNSFRRIADLWKSNAFRGCDDCASADSVLASAIDASRIGKAMLNGCWAEIMRGFGTSVEDNVANQKKLDDKESRRKGRWNGRIRSRTQKGMKSDAENRNTTHI